MDSQGHKYFSVIEDGSSVMHDSIVGGKGSIDSDTAVNNKNTRKLKRLPQKSEGKTPQDVSFIEDNTFLQSQSFFNESAATPAEGQTDERRAKSSLGTAENSAGRLRNRLAGVQK